MARMALEVYSYTKPAVSYRAWVGAIGLVALSVGLATGMTWRRTGARLAEVTRPEGWAMSFRVPREFTLADRDLSSELSHYSYKLANPQEFSAELSVWRVDARDMSAIDVCESILRRSGRTWIEMMRDSFPGLRTAPPATRSRETLGGREAVEVADPSLSTVVRSAIARDGAGYAISLRVSGLPLDETTYALFDITCRSVQFNTR